MYFKHLSQAATASLCIAMATTQLSAQEPKKMKGVDLFVDAEQYKSTPVILLDGTVHSANGDGALVSAGPVTFRIIDKEIDRESFRFFLNNCAGAPSNVCKVPLLVMTSGGSKNIFGQIILHSVKIAK